MVKYYFIQLLLHIIFIFSNSDLACDEEEHATPQQFCSDPLLQLVSLQKASGCWLPDPALAAALGKTSEETEKTKPPSVGYCLKNNNTN